ncbi:hypothetical protein [uncultured Psychroserpens sp.]|uniref:hypothetical protein n=1 Tax=uncultured Psychroserpens sp. TaxID=255436 RepID=UPI00261411CD|nr:hypothetical protein [uncultured Psychroserpens sp.]
MGFASKEDEENAYRTNDDMLGRSIRRGTDKALNALTFGLWGAVTSSSEDNSEGDEDCDIDPDFDPLTRLAKDAAREAPKAFKRSRERE